MNPTTRLAIATVSCLVSAACKNDSSEDSVQNARIQTLEAKIARLEDDNLSLRIKSNKSIFLMKSDSGFSSMPTDVGNLNFEMIDASQDGAGTRISMRVGNPTTATIKSFEITGSWSSIDKDGNPIGTPHNFVGKTSEQIVSGRWSVIHFDIAGAKPEDIGQITINEAVPKTISLGTTS